MTAAFIFRLKYFRANPKYYLLKGEQLFDEASNELVKTTEVMFATPFLAFFRLVVAAQ